MPVFSRSVPAGSPSAAGLNVSRKAGWFVHGAVARVQTAAAWPFTVRLVGGTGATVSLSTTCSVPTETVRDFWSPARLSSAS